MLRTVWGSFGAVLAGKVGLVAMAVAVVACDGSRPEPVGVTSRAVSLTQFTQPCAARNPIPLVDATLERRSGPPDTLAVPFSLQISVPVCVRVEVPEVNGHRLTSGEVALNEELLLGPSHFKKTFAGTTFTRSLPAGAHRVALSVASRPGTRVRVRVEVAGPVIDSISPPYGPTGTPIVVQGEGFVTPLVLQAGAVPLSSIGVSDQSSILATAVDSMPVGALTVTTPFGTATSADVFVPDQPSNVVQFYPMSEFELSGASCSGAALLRVRHDGSRLGFVLVDSQANDGFALDIDLDREPLTIERQLSSTRGGPISTVSATFAELGLTSHLTLGRMFLRVRTRGGCGDRQSEWIDLRSAFAPGFVIVRAAAPAALAARHGLTLVATEGELTLMGIPSDSTMDETLVALGRDPDSQGAIPDPVLYSSSHGTSRTCLMTGQVHDTGFDATGTRGASQWTLDRIGFVDHPNPVAGAGVVVAVADTGVTSTRDLAGALMAGFDFTIFGDGTSADIDMPTSTSSGFHGTSTAAVIGARQGNGGIVGVAPGVTILPLRVLGATGAADGFGLYRAFNRVLSLRPGVNIQVVNVSMAEFVDSIALWTGIAARLVRQGGISNVALAAGVVIGAILRSVVSSLHAAGVAVVASSGNLPICPGGLPSCFERDLYLAGGPQFPANAPGAYAIAATNSSDAPSAVSMPASPLTEIALAAPVGNLDDNGAVPATTPDGLLCHGGTSAAAPQVSGAAAYLLAPPPPLAPVASGTVALARLIQTAKPLSAPRTSIGAGLLNIAAATRPEVVWSFDFRSLFGRIDDLTFVGGFGDFALRNGGTTMESIPGPGGNVSTVVTGLPAATWLSSVPAQGVLLLGFSGSVQVRTASGVLVETRTGPSFRAAVSGVAAPAVGELVALGNSNGTVELVRANPLRTLATLAPATSSERYLDAVWAAEPGASSHQTLALRTATQIELFRVPTDLAANCSSQPAGCPVRAGAVVLTDGAGPLGPTDWAVVQDASDVRVYVVNGSSSVFIGSPATPAGFRTLVVGAQSWVDVETAPASTKVYVLDGNVPALAIIDDATVLQVDASRAAFSSFLMSRPLRVAPSGTYAYAPGQMGRLAGGLIEAWAVYLGGLVP